MRLELPLPGDWFALPIGDLDARSRIRAFAERVHGAADDRAGSRIRLRRRLQAALEHAERGRAEQLHVGVALEAGVPMPATIAVYPGVTVSGARDTEPGSVMDALVPLVLRAAHEGEGGSAIVGPDDRVLASPTSRILRRPRLQHVADEEVGELATLLVDYWVTVPGTREVRLVHVAAPDTPFATLLQPLFDEIVLGARFVAATPLAVELRRA